ncbi:MAG: DUF4386 family protein [Gemmatimonadota bacterium]
MPRILGVLIMLSGIGYVASCVTWVVFPASTSVVLKFIMPLYFGGLPIIFWLLIKGASEAHANAATPRPA